MRFREPSSSKPQPRRGQNDAQGVTENPPLGADLGSTRDAERSDRPTAVPERPRRPTIVSESLGPAAAQDSGPAAPIPMDEPTSGLTRRRVLLGVAFVAVMVVGLYFLVPKLAGLNHTWGEVSHGDAVWLALAAGLELFSIAGYVVLFRTVFNEENEPDYSAWRRGIISLAKSFMLPMF